MQGSRRRRLSANSLMLKQLAWPPKKRRARAAIQPARLSVGDCGGGWDGLRLPIPSREYATMPPHDPNDSDDEEEEDDEDDEEDENREPAVIRGNRGRGRINETCIPFSVEAHH